MLPGVAGIAVLTTILNVCAGDVPQLLFAVTVILPLVELAIVVIEFVAELPLHPPGNVHVYEVAPGTDAIL
jgi:hypothetical protein